MITKDYNTFKKQLINNGFIRVPASLVEFKFLDMKHIQFKGKALCISEKAIEDISHILGFSGNSIEKIDKIMTDNKSVIIINNLITASSNHKRKDITFVVNRQVEVLRVFNHAASGLSNESFFSIAEKVIDNNKLQIQNLTANTDGEIAIQTKGTNTEFQLERLSNEVFETGLSISNTHKGLFVDPFVQRLVCANGMVTKQFKDSLSVNSSSANVMDLFFNKLKEFQKRNFVSTEFFVKVSEAINTPASVAELIRGLNIIVENSEISRDQADLYLNYKQTFRDYSGIGVDLEKISAAKKKNARSGVSMWNLINSITDFASHDYGYNMEDPVKLQIKAGDMLCKEYDISNTMELCPY